MRDKKCKGCGVMWEGMMSDDKQRLKFLELKYEKTKNN